MCANYRLSKRETLVEPLLPPPDFHYCEAYPGSIVPVVTNFAPREWVPACFGLIPPWAKDAKIARSTYNAGAETVGEEPSFCRAWQRGRGQAKPAPAGLAPDLGQVRVIAGQAEPPTWCRV